jgi:hypothetical protein
MDLVAVHPSLALGHDVGLDPLRLAPFPPLRPTPARQQIRFIATLQVAIVVLAERLRAGSMVAVKSPTRSNRSDRPAFTASYSEIKNRHF